MTADGVTHGTAVDRPIEIGHAESVEVSGWARCRSVVDPRLVVGVTA